MKRLCSKSGFSLLLQVPALLSERERELARLPAGFYFSGAGHGLAPFVLPAKEQRHLCLVDRSSLWRLRHLHLRGETQGATPSLFRKAKLTRRGAISWLREEVVLVGWRHLRLGGGSSFGGRSISGGPVGTLLSPIDSVVCRERFQVLGSLQQHQLTDRSLFGPSQCQLQISLSRQPVPV